jgi:hypothetical protein
MKQARIRSTLRYILLLHPSFSSKLEEVYEFLLLGSIVVDWVKSCGIESRPRGCDTASS